MIDGGGGVIWLVMDVKRVVRMVMVWWVVLDGGGVGGFVVWRSGLMLKKIGGMVLLLVI